MAANYRGERDYQPVLVSSIMWQRWRCEKCGREGKIEISFTAARDGNAIEDKLEVSHRAISPICLGRPGKPRHVGEGKFMAGDYVTMDRGPGDPTSQESVRRSQAWVWKSREGRKATT